VGSCRSGEMKAGGFMCGWGGDAPPVFADRPPRPSIGRGCAAGRFLSAENSATTSEKV
jgi:hypothetical protein